MVREIITIALLAFLAAREIASVSDSEYALRLVSFLTVLIIPLLILSVLILASIVIEP